MNEHKDVDYLDTTQTAVLEYSTVIVSVATEKENARPVSSSRVLCSLRSDIHNFSFIAKYLILSYNSMTGEL